MLKIRNNLKSFVQISNLRQDVSQTIELFEEKFKNLGKSKDINKIFVENECNFNFCKVVVEESIENGNQKFDIKKIITSILSYLSAFGLNVDIVVNEKGI